MNDKFLEGLQYLNNNNPGIFNPKKGYEYYLKLLDEGFEYSKVVLGVLLSEGIGVEKDKELADRYFEETKQFANAEVIDFINQYVSLRSHNDLYKSLRELCKNINR